MQQFQREDHPQFYNLYKILEVNILIFYVIILWEIVASIVITLEIEMTYTYWTPN